MKHDYTWHTDADGAYQQCRHCGKIKGENDTLGGILKDECSRSITGFTATVSFLSIEADDVLLYLSDWTIGVGWTGEGQNLLITEEWERLRKGNTLLKRWTDEEDHDNL